MNLQRKLGITMHLVFKEAVAPKGPKPQYQNFNSHLLLLYIHFKSSGEKLSFNSLSDMSLILVTTLFNRGLTLQGEIWCTVGNPLGLSV